MKTQRKQLVLSVIALILCFTTLLGTTYAWFTDSAASVDNIIKSGSLDIAMYWNEDLADASSSTWRNVDDEENKVIFDYDKWEPGYTEVRYIKIVNEGDLAFKYVLDILPMGKVTKLAEVIDVYFLDPAAEITDREQLKNIAPVGTLKDVIAGTIPANGKLEENGDTAIVTIALKMRETAGNEYQGLSIGDSFSISLTATQLAYESDSFDNQYDKEAGFETFNGSYSTESAVETFNNQTAEASSMSDSNGKIKADIPSGVKLKDGTTSMSLTVKSMNSSSPNISVEANEMASTLDVHLEGVAKDNTVPIAVTLAGYLPKNLNEGNYSMYHEENGTNVEMRILAEGETPAHNTYTYDPATGDVVMHLASFSLFTTKAAKNPTWTGGVDYSWYDPRATRLTISNADQLAAFARIVGGMAKTNSGKDEFFPRDSFAGKVVKLTCDINLGWEGGSSWNGYPLNDADNLVTIDGKTVDPYFYPIGYYNSDGNFERTGVKIESGFRTFEGVFDGGGHTISNFYQNTWGMKGDNEYYSASLQRYRDGMGLFGRVYGGTIKNLTVDNFSSDGEYTTTGAIAAYADFGATFENIAITNCNPRVYNIGNGGIVGCVGWYTKGVTDTPVTFRNVTVDNSNKISALWGSYDVACGGVVGQYYPTSGQESAGKPKNAGIFFDNCHVAAQIDVYNDVCANYQYYAYRYAGILLGSVRENVTIDGREYPKMDGITAKDCTVHFGTWNDYYYCELVANSLASYTHDHQMSRLEQVASVDVASMKVTSLKGETTDIPSGRVNYVVVENKDANGAWIHGDGHDYAVCYHFVNGDQHFHDVADGDNPDVYETVDGEKVLKEDKQLVYREFNNLVTGYGWGVTSKGVEDMEGVKILDEDLAAHNEIKAVTKFDAKSVENATCESITLGTLFSETAQNDVKLSVSSVYANVKSDTVSAIFTRDANDWKNSTLKFSGAGKVQVTIQDYYYCEPTTIELNVTGHTNTNTFIGRVTADKDPDGVGYELWGCTTCKEAVKVVANHEDGHHFDNSGNCNCGATTSGSEKIVVASHDFSNYHASSFGLTQNEFLENIVKDGKWEVTATRPQYQSGSALQPAISKNVTANEKIVQMMRGEIVDNGILKLASTVYISFDLSYKMAENTTTEGNNPESNVVEATVAEDDGVEDDGTENGGTEGDTAQGNNINKAVLFSFRTTEMSGVSYQRNEVQLFAQVVDGVMSIAGDSNTSSFKALAANTDYTIKLAIVPETNAYRLLLSGGSYSDFVLKSGTLNYDLSNYNTTVFRSNDFSYVKRVPGYDYTAYENKKDDPTYAAFFENTARAALDKIGAIYIDNIEFACDTRTGITNGRTSGCVHSWTAKAIAGETDLYRYTCSNPNCGYYFTGVKGDVVKVNEFASMNFDSTATQTHENLVITTSNNNQHFKPGNSTEIVDLNINVDQKYFSDGKLDITTNSNFYIAGPSVVVTDLNNPFIVLMNGEWEGNKVDAVEMTFDLQYTGDITKLSSTGLGLLFYQTGVSGSTKNLCWLNFDKNTDNNSGVLYFKEGNANEKTILTEGQTYTVTLRWELNPTAEGKYLTSFVVRDALGNKIGAGQKAEASSFGNFYQMIFGRPAYQVAGFHIYFDNLIVNYETAVDGIN